jgi:hypothetical protein
VSRARVGLVVMMFEAFISFVSELSLSADIRSANRLSADCRSMANCRSADCRNMGLGISGHRGWKSLICA